MKDLSEVLLICDFDNTIAPTGQYLAEGRSCIDVPEENRRAILRFMAEGGHFAVVTGRAFPAFRRLQPLIPTNCPTGIFNGAAIYDYEKGIYLTQHSLPASAPTLVHRFMDAFPTVSFEAFTWGAEVFAVRPNEYVERHQRFTGAPWVEIAALEDAPLPIAKLVIEDEEHTLKAAAEFIRSQEEFKDFDAIFSTPNLLEFTARGANKGGAAEELCALLGIQKEHLYCAGDQENDLAMLEIASEAFIPADCNPLLFDRGFTPVRPCTENSIADIVERLEERYL